MWASFKYSLLQLVRVPGVLIWTLVFPIVLGSLFVMMLGALDERAEAVSVNVVVVDEEQAKGEERSALSFENIARAAQAGAQVGSVFDEEAFGEQAFATFMEALGEGARAWEPTMNTQAMCSMPMARCKPCSQKPPALLKRMRWSLPSS